jgi:hypothetical protein
VFTFLAKKAGVSRSLTHCQYVIFLIIIFNSSEV